MFRISSMSLSSLLFQHSPDLFVKVGINTLGFIDNLSRKLPFPASSGHHPAQILYGYTHSESWLPTGGNVWPKRNLHDNRLK